MTKQRHVPLLIVGSGPAGYTAAVYAARAMLAPVLVQGMQPGGQLTITTDVENWPGEISILGPELVARMEVQAREAGTEMIFDTVARLDLSTQPFLAVCDSGLELRADAVILATGAQAKWLGLPSEQKFKGFGVSACATCDGFFYRDQDVAVIGGGNSAVEEALYLANIASSVTLVCRSDTLKAEQVLQQRLFASPKVRILWNHTTEEILGGTGSNGVEALRLRDTHSGDTKEVDVKGVFVAIGHDPASALVKDQLETHSGGYVRVAPGSTATSVPGVFAAGDLTDPTYRQAITSAGMGCMAALDAERYLAQLRSNSKPQ